MQLKIRPLTPDLWPALEDLFGPRGACNNCWCMYWRIGAAYRKRPGDKNKAAFREIVKNDLPVWSLSCLYVRIGYRRKGVTSALIAAALKVAKRAHAPALEAYPLDASKTPSASGTGYATTFARAGFKTVASPTAPPPIMRHNLKQISPSRAPPESGAPSSRRFHR